MGKSRLSYSSHSKSLIKPVESGGKTRGVKKVTMCHDNSAEKLKKQPNLYGKKKIKSNLCFSLTSQWSFFFYQM